MAAEGIAHILTIDVGNTSTRLGAFALLQDKSHAMEKPTGTWELTTPSRITADEARLLAAQALRAMGITEVAGAIVSCVVPSLTDPWRRAASDLSATRALVVGPGLKTGLSMRYDDPSEVGPDRIADVTAARETYGAPAVIIDLGTTTNFEVIDGKGAFAGGIIAPGVTLGARSLAEAAARLPMIELRAPGRVVGKNTRAAMQSGVVLGEVARIDGLLDAIATELGWNKDVPVVMTGENAGRIARLLRHEAVVDDTLTLRGLALLWSKNQR